MGDAGRGRRLRRVAITAAALVLAVTSIGGANAAPGRRPAAAPGGGYGIPPLPYNPTAPTFSGWEGTAYANAIATKLRTTVRLSEQSFLGWLRQCAQVGQSGTYDPVGCPDFHPPRTSFDRPFEQGGNPPIWLQTDGPVWVASPRGVTPRLGSFAPVRVRTLAFGSLPVTATVALRQTRTAAGYVSPLQLRYLIDTNPVPSEGGSIYANRYWPGLRWGSFTDGLTRYTNQYLAITGRVDVSISDVRVDGRPVDVGPRCRSSRPARLSLTSPTGLYVNTAPASTLKGRPGGAQVLSGDDPGSIQGNVEIPAFAGCGSASEDLDPLLDGLVSSPRNPVDVVFTSAFNQCAPTPDCDGVCQVKQV